MFLELTSQQGASAVMSLGLDFQPFSDFVAGDATGTQGGSAEGDDTSPAEEATSAAPTFIGTPGPGLMSSE